MNTLIRSRRRAAARVAAIRNSAGPWTNPDAWVPLAIGGQQTQSGVTVGLKSALGYPPLWRAINLIADPVSMVGFYLYRRDANDAREKAKGHPSYRLLLTQANQYQTASIFRHTMTLHAQCKGNGYAWIERNGYADPIGLWLLDPEQTYPVVEVTGIRRKVYYITRTINGEQRRINAEDVFHLRGPSYDGFCGLSVLDLMAQSLGIGIAANRFAELFFGQGLNARGFLIAPGKLNDKELQHLKDSWPRMNAGLSRAHLPAILTGGMTFLSTSVDPDKAQALETRQFEVKEVANITGVPARYLGDDGKSSYNSLENESKEFLNKTIDPWLDRWEDEARAKLLTEDEKAGDEYYFECQRSDLIRINEKELTEIMRWERETGIASVNDILRRKNQPPIGPAGDVRHVPANWTILTDQPPEPTAPPANDPEGDPGEADDGEAENRRRAAIQALAEHRAGVLIRSEADQVRRAAKRESNFVAWMDRYYPKQQAKIAAEFALVLAVLDAADCEPEAAKMAAEHVEMSISELLTAADGDRDGFVERVEAVSARWESERAAEMVADILGGV